MAQLPDCSVCMAKCLLAGCQAAQLLTNLAQAQVANAGPGLDAMSPITAKTLQHQDHCWDSVSPAACLRCQLSISVLDVWRTFARPRLVRKQP